MTESLNMQFLSQSFFRWTGDKMIALDSKPLSKTGIEELLVMLPVLEAKKSPYATIESSAEYILPNFVWSVELTMLHEAIYKTGLVQPYDWASWQDEADKLYANPELLRNADIKIIQKLLTLHVRKERFCEGHFAAMCESGHILAILRRLQELWAAGLVKAV